MIRRPIATFCSVALLAAACASAGPPTIPNDREWNPLLDEYRRLETLRNSAPPAPGGGRGDQIEHVLQVQKTIEPTYVRTLDAIDSYWRRTADPRAARILAREKVRLGDHYMNLLSQYDRAIAYYQAAIAIDPSSEEARQRLAFAENRRFLAADEFSLIRDGMSMSEVERIAGMPAENWIRQMTQNGRVYTVWIYPREGGGAAAVYFENGKVYHRNWTAAPSGGDDIDD